MSGIVPAPQRLSKPSVTQSIIARPMTTGGFCTQRLILFQHTNCRFTPNPFVCP